MTVTIAGAGTKSLPQNLEGQPTVTAAAAGHDSVLEPKWDGWRTLWVVDDKARFYTRTGNELTGAMPAVQAELERVLPPGSIVDGEVVAITTDENGRVIHKRGAVASILGSSTAKAALRSSELTLVVFDLLQHDGIDARPLDFARRRKLLEMIFDAADFGNSVLLCPQLEVSEENYDNLLAAGYEGGVVKWLDAPYRSGRRGGGQFKVKASHRDEAIVVGYKDGENSFEGLIGAIEFGQYDDDGLLVHRGRCSGMDMQTRIDISENRDSKLGDVFEFSYLCVEEPQPGAKYGAFRSPQFKLWRPDKPAEEVTIQHA